MEDISNLHHTPSVQETVPPIVENPKPVRSRLPILLLLLCITLIGSGYYSYGMFRTPQPTKQNISMTSSRAPLITPTPRSIPHGPKRFSVGQSDKKVPQFSNGTIDPYDPEMGGTQSITISLQHSQPISTVTLKLKTDHKISEAYPLTLSEGTPTNGVWKGTWQINDTYLYTYGIVLQAVSNTTTASVEITMR